MSGRAVPFSKWCSPERIPRMSACRIIDRKSTRLNSSHSQISYAVFCLKKKKKLYKATVTNPTSAINYFIKPGPTCDMQIVLPSNRVRDNNKFLIESLILRYDLTC